MQVYQAAQNGKLKLIQRLSACGLNVANDDKWTPMHFAVLGGNSEAIRYLIQQDLGVNNRTNTGQSPLHFAAQAGNEFVIAVLVENGAILDSQDNLEFLLTNNNYMAIKFLLEFKADPDILDDEGYAPLHVAVERGSSEIVKLLLDFNANPSNIKIIRKTVRIEKPMMYWAPFHIAAQNNYPDILRLLLEKNPNPDIKKKTGVTPLHIAAQQKCIESLDVLLEYNADIMSVDDDIEPPLYLAISSRLPKHVAKLCNDQTIINMNINGETALHIACKLGFSEIVSFLIEKGTNVYACDKKGNTPLHYAVSNKHKECVKLLLDTKADMLFRNENHESPFVMSSGEISALMKNYLEKNKETVRADPIDKTPRSTRTVPSRLRSQM